MHKVSVCKEPSKFTTEKFVVVMFQIFPFRDELSSAHQPIL